MSSTQIKDVLVIGTGIIGCAVAYEAARMGMAVGVLDRGRPGSGSSGVGGGFISIATKKPGPHRDLARASASIYASLEEELGQPKGALGYRQNGSLILAMGGKDLPTLESLKTQDASSRREALTPDALGRLEPNLSPRLAGALYFPEDAEVFPVRVLDAYVEAGERWGVRYLPGRTVTSARRDGSVWEVQTEKDTFSAPNVVIAAGAWSGEVGSHFGIKIPVKPRRGQALLIPSPSPLLHHPMLSAGYFGAKHSPAFAPPSDVQLSLWHRPDGVLFAGGTREWAGFDSRPDERLLREIRRQTEHAIPSLASAPPGHHVLGFRPYSGTGLPLIGPVPNRPGLFLATGHEGDGISLAPVTGRLIAQCLAGETPTVPLDPFLLPEAHGAAPF